MQEEEVAGHRPEAEKYQEQDHQEEKETKSCCKIMNLYYSSSLLLNKSFKCYEDFV